MEAEAGDALEVGVVGEEGEVVLQGKGGDEEVRKRKGNALGAKRGRKVAHVGPSGTGGLQVGEALEGCVYALSVLDGAGAGQELGEDHATDMGLALLNEGCHGLPACGVTSADVLNPCRGINDNAGDALQLWPFQS